MAIDRVTGFQTELSERIRGRRRTRLTVRSPGGGHRTTTVGFRHGLVRYDARDVTSSAATVIDAPAVQQMSVAISDSGILRENIEEFFCYFYC